jgi:hypothetical protein
MPRAWYESELEIAAAAPTFWRQFSVQDYLADEGLVNGNGRFRSTDFLFLLFFHVCGPNLTFLLLKFLGSFFCTFTEIFDFMTFKRNREIGFF